MFHAYNTIFNSTFTPLNHPWFWNKLWYYTFTCAFNKMSIASNKWIHCNTSLYDLTTVLISSKRTSIERISWLFASLLNSTDFGVLVGKNYNDKIVTITNARLQARLWENGTWITLPQKYLSLEHHTSFCWISSADYEAKFEYSKANQIHQCAFNKNFNDLNFVNLKIR